MSVMENIRFGLTVRNFDRAAQRQVIDRVLDLVQMRDYGNRKPNELSGGQQQRVALAQALAVNPACLLLDEPLSNLDAKLRHEMRSEIRRICKAAGSTTVYVTHDQKEALSIADRIALLNAGKLVQIGTPGELYHRPRTSFVADFIGHSNLLPGRIVGRDSQVLHVETPAGRFIARSTAGKSIPDVVHVSIRPEQIQIARNGPTPNKNRLTGRPIESTFLGEASEHVLLVDGRQRIRVIATPPLFDVPSELDVEFDPQDVVVLAE